MTTTKNNMNTIIYRAYHHDLNDGNTNSNFNIGYFLNRGDAQSAIDNGDYYVQGVRRDPDGRPCKPAAGIEEIECWNSYGDWSRVKHDQKRAAALAKLTPAERKMLGL